MTDRPSVSISQIQKSTTTKRRTSLAQEAQDFKERNSEATWKENSEVKNCSLCKTKFTLTKRRHHCRDCGGIFCGKCSSFKTVIEGELKRSCFSCYKKAVGKDSTKSSVVIDTGAALNKQQQQRQSIVTSSAPAPSESEAGPRPSDVSGEDSDLPNWAEAILFIRRSGGDGPVLKASFPEDCLTEEMMQDIYLNAMPKPLRGNKKQEIKYFFRVRDKQLPGPDVRDENEESVGTLVTKTTIFYNCYVFYRQQVVYDNEIAAGSNTNGTLMRQAIILVSKWPFPRLAFRMLEKLDEACFWSAETTKAAPQSSGNRVRSQSSSGSYSPTKSSANESNSTGWDLSAATINNVLMVGFGQLGVWPTATPSSLIYLHFFGELLQYSVAANIWSTYGANLSFSSVLPSINLVALFAPLGLLQHLWVLWELIVAGQDIVVVGSSPTQCSEVVLALSSLLLPLFRVTDLRPYIHEDDSDIPLIGATAEMKYQRMFEGSEQTSINDKSMIVGVTDLAVLNYFECFGALLLLPPPKKVEPSSKQAPVDQAFTGMRTKNAAIFHQLGTGNAPKKANRNIFKKRSSVTASKGSSGGGNSGSFVDYCSNWLDNGSSQVALVTRHQTSSMTVKKLLVKIKNMNPNVRNVLGDKLLRDNLQEMTLSIFKSSVGGGTDGITNVEATNMKESMIERAELAEERAQQSEEGKGTAGAIITPNELWSWFMALPMWMLGNVPTVLMWVAYFGAYLLGYILGIPPVLLLAGGFLVKVPEKASPQFEALLSSFLPAWFLFPEIGKSTAGGASAGGSVNEDSKNNYAAKDEAVAPVKVDFSGVWKRVRLENYDGLLAAQGAGFMQRKLAASIPMVHTITMDEGCSVFRLQEKGGPIDTDNTYVIDGPEIASTTLKNSYLDKLTRNGKTLRLRKVIMPGQEYELMMERELLDNGKTLKVKGTFTDLKGKNPTVVGSTYFELVGPSPNARPAGVPGATAPSAAAPAEGKATAGGASAAGTVAPASNRTDLSGVWNRTKTANFEAFVGASGGGFMQRKLAASMNLTHTITMDAPKLEAFALHEKGGPIDIQQTLTIGASFQPFLINGKKFKQRAYWQKDVLVFIRRADDDTYDLIMTRTIEGDQMILKSVHKDLLTGKETEATSWFTKIGKSTNPIPKADPSLVKNAADAEDASAAPAEAEVEDVDNDDDDDDQALAKMRSVSTAASKTNLTSLTGAITQVSKNTDFGGVWIQNNATHFDAAQVDVNMSLTHTITMQKREVRVKESICGRVIDDSTYSVDAEEVTTEHLGKACRVRIYFEGKTLVLHRINDDDQVEYFIRRDLEDEGKVLRLVTLQRNLYTGEESESMTLFNNAKWLN